MIDAHVHVWRIGQHGCTWPPPSMPMLHRDFTLDDWQADAGEATGAVLIQSQEDAADTEWLLTLGADPRVMAVVGWADLERADAVTALARRPKLRGLRPMVQDREPDWFDRPALEAGWRAMVEAGLTLDALVRPRHLPSLARLARRYPSLTIVVDHGAKPVPGDLSVWRRDMAVLAAMRQVHCKLSGLLTELAPNSPSSRIEPVVTALVELFGPDRLIWGSDWPVLRLAGRYRDWIDQVRALVAAEQHASVFANAARTAYGIAA